MDIQLYISKFLTRSDLKSFAWKGNANVAMRKILKTHFVAVLQSIKLVVIIPRKGTFDVTIFEAIRKVVKKYEKENGEISLVRQGGMIETSFNLEEEIIFLLLERGVQNIVELVEAHDDSYGTWYVLCISYIENGELKTYNVPVYA